MNDIRSLTSAQVLRIISIKKQMEQLQGELDSITGSNDYPVPFAAEPRKKRRMSAAGRARIAAAARARWAKVKGRSVEAKPKAAKKKDRRSSPAVRAKLAAAARERWRKAKAEGKATL